MERRFGTDGIRGVAGREPITPDAGRCLGRALVAWCRRRNHPTRMVIGRDTRVSGPELQNAVAAGIASEGGSAWGAGVIPTPAVAYLARDAQAGAGVVISASHNPAAYNGFKVFSPLGYKLAETEEREIEEAMGSFGPMPSEGECSPPRSLNGARERYLAFLRDSIPQGISFSDLRIVLDCANGAASALAPLLFGEACASVDILFGAPNGVNINDGCGSEHTGPLERRVAETGAHAGLAFDGDADRLIAVDEMGRTLTGDQMIAVCAKMLAERGQLKNPLVVTTVMSNLGLRAALKEMGVAHVAAQVGDRHVAEAMRAKGAVLGGESSGHLIFSDRHTTGDGMLSAIQLLAALKWFDQPLSRLAGIMTVFPQVLVNVPVSRKPEISQCPDVWEVVKEVERRLGDRGRVLVRYSGTEPLCRVMVEGEDPSGTKAMAHRIARVIRERLG